MRYTRLVAALVAFVLLSTSSHAQSTGYSNTCLTNVDNATVLLPPGMDKALPNGSSLAPGDTIAVRNADGDCVGYGVWANDGNDVVISAAGPTALSQTTGGYTQDDTMLFEVYDESNGTTINVGDDVTYASCSSLSLSPCQDDGTYADGVIFVVDAFKSSSVPVKLAQLKAEQEGKRVHLEWTTAQEVNNAGFDVQHRRTGLPTTDWKTLKFVEGSGTTSEPTSYSITTKALEVGDHEFRLRQVDHDGSTTLSEKVSVEFKLQKEYRLSKVAPNPVQDRGRLSVTVREQQKVTVSLFNVLGQRVATLHSEMLAANEQTTLDLDTSQLSSGQYFVRVSGESFTATRRTTVVK